MPYFFSKNVYRFNRIPQKRYIYPTIGIERFPTPPFILVANHISSLDGYLLGAEMINYIPRKVHMLGQKPRHGGWVTEIIAKVWVELIIVDPLNAEKAIDEAVEYLGKGDVVILFPEGKTNFDRTKLLKGKTGAARMAIKARVPIVPIGISGGPYMHGIGNGRRWFQEHPTDRMQYTIGTPFDLSEYYDQPLNYEALQNATRNIMTAIGQLTGQAYPY